MSNEEVNVPAAIPAVDPMKVLVAELKQAGLNVGEDAAKEVVKAVFAAVPKFVLATENKVDDLLVAILPVVEPHVLKLLDKIDGKEG